MKRKISILIASVLLLLVGCSKADQTGYISLSDNSCSFNYDGGSTTVMISASDSWHATTNVNWLSVEESPNSVQITVDENSQKAERVGEITVISGSDAATITIYQAGNNNIPVIYRNISVSTYSPNKYYAAGLRLDTENDVQVVYIGLFDLRNDRVIQFGPYNADSYPLSTISTIDDHGNMYIANEGGTKTYYFNKQTASIDFFAENVIIYHCSSDGSVVVGVVSFPTAGSEYPQDFPSVYLPRKWVNGVEKALPMPEKPFRGDAYGWFAGLLPRAVSADGKIIYGTEWQSSDWFMIWWDENDDWHYVGEDVRELNYIPVTDGSGNTYMYAMVSGMINSNAKQAMPQSGEWICGWYYTEQFREDGAIIGTHYPAFYDVKHNKTHIFYDYPESCAVSVKNDGSAGFIRTNAIPLGNTSIDTSDIYAVNPQTETTISTAQQWFFDNYGIYPPAKSLPYGFSDDDTIVTFINGSYILDKR